MYGCRQQECRNKLPRFPKLQITSENDYFVPVTSNLLWPTWLDDGIHRIAKSLILNTDVQGLKLIGKKAGKNFSLHPLVCQGLASLKKQPCQKYGAKPNNQISEK